MKLTCPECESKIPVEDIDFSSESAFCSHCQKDFACRSWIEEACATPKNLEHPPKGAWFNASMNGFKVGVSTRSFRWLFFLPVAVFWSGLLVFFSYGFLHAPPAMRWLLFLFLTPFYLAGLFLWARTLMAVFGRVVVEVDGRAGTIFRGVWPIGWKSFFDASQVEKIRIGTVYTQTGNHQQIVLEAEKTIILATGVRPDRLRFMFIALHQMRPARLRAQNPVADSSP